MKLLFTSCYFRLLLVPATALVCQTIWQTVCFVSNCNKKFQLMLLRCARAYGSSCSQVILVYLHPFHRNSLFCSHKSPKTHIKSIFSGIKVIVVDLSKKLVASACYDKQHVCVYLQPFSRYTSQQRINIHFLEGYSYLTLACTGLREPRGFGRKLLKSTFLAENFICGLSWFIPSRFGAIYSWNMCCSSKSRKIH